ncbi:hypothetical protein NDU88_005247 [Pleurodeles waltl]|uniref:Uncharacterized protein n=1 Tax=Pleurodeles waltl TaxID=8319 RepID=A0AAV7L4B4_PLEWA|nr:hypothetical protein NDU88_005247 [Pleurodeles waltl]
MVVCRRSCSLKQRRLSFSSRHEKETHLIDRIRCFFACGLRYWPDCCRLVADLAPVGVAPVKSHLLPVFRVMSTVRQKTHVYSPIELYTHAHTLRERK